MNHKYCYYFNTSLLSKRHLAFNSCYNKRLFVASNRQAFTHCIPSAVRYISMFNRNNQDVFKPRSFEITIFKRKPSDPPFPSISCKFSDTEQTINRKSDISETDSVDKNFETESFKTSERARQAEDLWNTFVPERNIGLRSPVFWILAATCLCLHSINQKRETKQTKRTIEERRLEEELREAAEEKNRARIASFVNSRSTEEEEEEESSSTAINHTLISLKLTTKNDESIKSLNICEDNNAVKKYTDNMGG